MPASPPYIPRKQADLDSWAANFSTLLTSSPAAYGQTSGTAAAVAAAYAAWLAAYTPVTSKTTKTPAAVSAKDAAMVSMLAVLRPVAVNISLNAGVSTSLKTGIGVNPRTNTPQPISPPTTYPILTVQAGAALQLYVRYRDSAASVSVKSKPYGVAVVDIYYQQSVTPVTDPSTLTQKIVFTKSPTLLQFTAGGQCYLAGRYVTKNGKYSGYGPIVSFTVPTSA